jgi:uncharacterized protein
MILATRATGHAALKRAYASIDDMVLILSNGNASAVMHPHADAMEAAIKQQIRRHPCGRQLCGRKSLMVGKSFTAGLVALVLCMCLAAPVAAGPFEDGLAAYGRADYASALRLIRPLAEQGNPSAQAMLGLMSAIGRGVTQDYAAALTWYRKAADQGLASAQSDLASIYDQGFGVKQDYAAALTWYRKAADQGFASAEYNLGLMYANGKGVPKDPRAAVTWLRKAADHGDISARFNLGVMYANGEGVPQDFTAAVGWYRQAAEYGYADAQYSLGSMYASGKGVPRDYVTADMWFYVAVAAGNQDALQDREVVERRMSPAQIAEAQKLAREWKPRSN